MSDLFGDDLNNGDSLSPESDFLFTGNVNDSNDFDNTLTSEEILSPPVKDIRQAGPFAILCLLAGIASILLFCLPWVGVALAGAAIVLGILSMTKFGSYSTSTSGKAMTIIGLVLAMVGGVVSGILWFIGKIVWDIIQ